MHLSRYRRLKHYLRFLKARFNCFIVLIICKHSLHIIDRTKSWIFLLSAQQYKGWKKTTTECHMSSHFCSLGWKNCVRSLEKYKKPKVLRENTSFFFFFPPQKSNIYIHTHTHICIYAQRKPGFYWKKNLHLYPSADISLKIQVIMRGCTFKRELTCLDMASCSAK